MYSDECGYAMKQREASLKKRKAKRSAEHIKDLEELETSQEMQIVGSYRCLSARNAELN